MKNISDSRDEDLIESLERHKLTKKQLWIVLDAVKDERKFWIRKLKQIEQCKRYSASSIASWNNTLIIKDDDIKKILEDDENY